MLKYLWQLLVVGFPEKPPKPPDCEHEWSQWACVKLKKGATVSIDQFGCMTVRQTRKCDKCGFTQSAIERHCP